MLLSKKLYLQGQLVLKRKAEIASGTTTSGLVLPGQLTVGTSLEPKQQTPELMGMYTLLYLKLVTSKVLVYGIGDSAQRYMAAWMGEGFGGEWIHIYM